MFKKLGKMALLPILAMGVIGCTSEEEKYIGTWENEKISLTLLKASVCKTSEQGRDGRKSFSCEWNYDEKVITIAGSEQFSLKLDNSKLILSPHRGEEIFELSKVINDK